MLFVTESFLLFFVVVYLVYWAVPAGWRLPFLLGASLFFYATWSFLFTLHFLGVIGINYVVMEIWKVKRSKLLFIALQVGNVANIAVFKYYYFLADFLGVVTGVDAWRHPQLILEHRDLGTEIFLPLAISFYTFQIMAYGFDIYRGTYAENHRFRDVVLFKSFFPQLIAGPIMRSSELLPQIANYVNSKAALPDANRTKKGLWLILIGVVKKMLLGDQLMLVISPVLSTPIESIPEYSPAMLWFVYYCTFIFIYLDFSAYSDMARGFGYLLGFEIPINFRAPALAHTVAEFWRRWHVTFSLWIRDYIFIPLGGSRVAEWRVYFNYVFAFFLGGLWHGASYAFVIWGVLMGVALSIDAFLMKRGLPEWPENIFGRVARFAFTWWWVSITCVFFFAPSPERLGATDSFDALRWCLAMVGHMLNPVALFTGEFTRTIARTEVMVIAILGTMFFSWFEIKPAHFTRWRKYENKLLPAAALIVILLLVEFAGGKKDFFYFQF